MPESVCTSCHSKDALVEATAASDALVDAEGTVFNPHAFPQIEKHKKLSCISCHTMHEPADIPMGDAANAACTKCHHEGVFRACNSCHDA